MADAPSGYLLRTLPGNGHDVAWGYKPPPLVVAIESLTPLGLVVAAELSKVIVAQDALEPIGLLVGAQLSKIIVAQDALEPLGLVTNAQLIPLVPCENMVTEVYPLVIGCETVVSLPYDEPDSSSSSS